MNNRSHLAIDLDALEAQLDPTESAGQGRRPQFDDARLAELARIVGQDDRFRTLLPQATADIEPAWPDDARAPASRRAYGNDDAPGSGYGRPEPDAYAQDVHAYEQAADEQAYQDWEGGHDAAAAEAPSPRAGHDAVHDFELAAQPVYPQALDPMDAVDEEQPDPAPHAPSRRRLYLIAAAVGVIAVGTIGAVAMRGKDSVAANGDAPIIKADSSPVKVQPPQDGTNTDTTANKAIYERVGQPASTNTKVVDGREEPVDVQQTVRQQQAAVTVPSERSEVSTFGAPGVAALPANPTNRDPTSGLGEPRRVKTIAVRPDGTVIPESAQRATKPAAGAPVPGAASTPGPVAAAPAPATTSKQTARVAETRSDDGASAPRTTGSMPLSIAPLGQRPAAAPAAAPVEVASAPADEDAAPAPTRRTTGDYAVQLGAPGSEQEARDVFANLKRRFPTQLGPFQPTIVKAQSAGRTVYRVRVGQMARDEATKLCERLKAAGGSCFVAR